MTEREQQRIVRHRLAVLRHVAEVSGNVAQACRFYGISRQTFYRWLSRYEELGVEGLKDRSSKPHHSGGWNCQRGRPHGELRAILADTTPPPEKTTPTVSLAATELTNSRRRELTNLAAITASQVTPTVRGADPNDIDGWWNTRSGTIAGIVSQGFASAGRLAGPLPRRLRADIESATVEPIIIDPDPDQITTALRITGPVAFKTQLRNSGSTDAPLRIMTRRSTASAARLALLGARRTTMATVDQAPAIVGFRRVTAPNPCKFCQMLADRCAVFKTSDAAAFVVG